MGPLGVPTRHQSRMRVATAHFPPTTDESFRGFLGLLDEPDVLMLEFQSLEKAVLPRLGSVILLGGNDPNAPRYYGMLGCIFGSAS